MKSLVQSIQSHFIHHLREDDKPHTQSYVTSLYWTYIIGEESNEIKSEL